MTVPQSPGRGDRTSLPKTCRLAIAVSASTARDIGITRETTGRVRPSAARSRAPALAPCRGRQGCHNNPVNPPLPKTDLDQIRALTSD